MPDSTSAFTLAASVAPAPLSVRVERARLVYGGEALFDDLDFELAAGQWTCLLGPSGVGKSTLLRLIAGLAPADPKTSVVCGDGDSVSGRAAYMAQQDLLLPWLGLLDNVMLGSRLRGARPDRGETPARARALLERVGLADRLHARPQVCSGGMRQRAALVRTLIEARPVVLMDEPFSALDAITRIRLQALAAELLVGRTVLLVTHDPLEALRLGHRIFVMAGKPARLEGPLEPAAAPPRDPTEPRVVALHHDLLERLLAAGGAP
jgi:putative hydroxymethylpyrimidine transport system ATP-binding protein